MYTENVKLKWCYVMYILMQLKNGDSQWQFKMYKQKVKE